MQIYVVKRVKEGSGKAGRVQNCQCLQEVIFEELDRHGEKGKNKQYSNIETQRAHYQLSSNVHAAALGCLTIRQRVPRKAAVHR